jgi:[NiFe] hydrogenase diaphorase moiety large subunit
LLFGSMSVGTEIQDAVARGVARRGSIRTGLLSLLRDVQEELGQLSGESLDAIARTLGVPRAEVESTASFYHFFHAESHGAFEILFSNNIVDQMQGQHDLMQYLCERLWIQPAKLSEDGLVYVDTTSDIGLGDQGPAALVNGHALPSLDRNRLDLIASLVRERKPLSDWPRMLFDVADNVRRAGPLLAAGFEPGCAVRRVLDLGPDAMLTELDLSNLRGRGGAGYQTATKWRSCGAAAGDAHYVVCNADEGEPGTFTDRVLLQSHADLVLDGMTVLARVIGGRRGFIYLRGEYLYLLAPLEAALERRRCNGLLGADILGTSGFDFDIEIRVGAGAYVCGEETALIESLEGKPGKPRNRPPYPDTRGYLGEPTVVNNAETFACAARIAVQGGGWFASIGTAHSTGTKLLSVSGDCRRPGIYEYPFGVTVRQVLTDCGAVHPQAVQVGGPSGTCVSWKEFDRRIAIEDLPTAGAFMVFSRERDMFEVARNFSHFFADESCGFCTPCRVGTTLVRNTMDKLAAGKGSAHDMRQMSELTDIMRRASHCGLGHTAANPVVQTMQQFPEYYERRLAHLDFEPAFDLDAALQTARLITGRDDAWAHVVSEEP